MHTKTEYTVQKNRCAEYTRVNTWKKKRTNGCSPEQRGEMRYQDRMENEGNIVGEGGVKGKE